MIKRLVKNFSALFAGEFVAQLCHFASVIYVARVIGADGFGQISFSIAIISYFLMVTNLGLGEVGVRQVSRNADVNDVAGTILSMRGAIGLASFAVIGTIAYFMKGAAEMPFLLLVYGLGLFPYALSLEWVFRGTERMKYNAYGKVISSVLLLVLTLIFVKTKNDILKVAFIAFTADYIGCGFFYSAYKRRFGGLRIHLDFKRWKALVPVAVQLFLSSAMLLVYNNFGTLALGFLKGERAVGIYASAFKVISLSYAVSYLFVIAIFPTISRLYHESSDRLKGVLNNYVKISLALGLPAGVIGTILGGRIIGLLYGPSYADAGLLFRIMCWFVAINLTSYTLSYNLIACDRQGIYLKILGIATGFNILLNIFGIPFFGYYAPAAAIVAAEFIVLISTVLVMKGFSRVELVELSKKPIVAAMVMAVVLGASTRLNMALAIPLSAAAYVGTLALIGGITKDEIIKLKEALVGHA